MVPQTPAAPPSSGSSRCNCTAAVEVIFFEEVSQFGVTLQDQLLETKIKIALKDASLVLCLVFIPKGTHVKVFADNVVSICC